MKNLQRLNDAITEKKGVAFFNDIYQSIPCTVYMASHIHVDYFTCDVKEGIGKIRRNAGELEVNMLQAFIKRQEIRTENGSVNFINLPSF